MASNNANNLSEEFEKKLTVSSKPARNVFIFDLDTTGFISGTGDDKIYPDIIQICAKDMYSTEPMFQKYVKPKKTITRASDVNGIRVDGNGNMTHNGEPVESLSLTDAIAQFLDYLGTEKRYILCAHNGKQYDVPILKNALRNIGNHDEFMRNLDGFVDTIPLAKRKRPGLKFYRLENLIRELLPDSKYDAHKNPDKVRALIDVMTKIGCTEQDFYDSMF